MVLSDVLRLLGPDVGAHGLEGASVALPFGPGEHVCAGNQLHVQKPGLLDGI